MLDPALDKSRAWQKWQRMGCLTSGSASVNKQSFRSPNTISNNYRSRQYHESKVLHNTEVSWCSTSHGPLKTDHFDKDLIECRSPIQYASFDTFKSKIGQLSIPQSMNVWISKSIVILVKNEAKCLKNRPLKELYKLIKTPSFLQKKIIELNSSK